MVIYFKNPLHNPFARYRKNVYLCAAKKPRLMDGAPAYLAQYESLSNTYQPNYPSAKMEFIQDNGFRKALWEKPNQRTKQEMCVATEAESG